MTFLFSDIEGSTSRWERDREAMAAALARHDALMRAALEARGAYVFKTMGDAFCAAFPTALAALLAAREVQRALAREDFSAVDGLRVRIALHAGSADERDGDYFGPTVNRVARLLAAGHGGQVLVSSSCIELLGDDLPAECSLRDLGEHRLKDLAQPERIHQLLAPELTAEFPRVRSLEHLTNNLPAQVTSFVGREAEMSEVAALVEQHRLVTLVGSGGIGKTRLSLHVAADLIDGSADGVWFVELAPLAKGEYIPTTVALALGITLPSEGDPVENLARQLKRKKLLLVFDNCEHLIEPAAAVISAILRAAPQVKVLASSRQRLGIAAEATYHVPSFDLPTSIALFEERARAASTKFVVTRESAPIVAEICRRLDGIPLAIKLAAARVKMLGVRPLRDRLDERFGVLTDGGRDVLPRQQTLRALIDWSHDLLDEGERVLFRRLGIFAGGFALEGALAVANPCDPDPGRRTDPFDVLASLVDKSLVLAEPQGDAVRYRLLESTRAYALERLDGAGERDLIARCHLGYLRDRFAALWEDYERTGRYANLVTALQTELDDVRAALDDALSRSGVVDGAELLANVHTAWRAIGLEAEGTSRCEAYLAALTPDQSRLRARLLMSLSQLLSDSGRRLRAFEVAAEAVEQARASGDTASLRWALNALANAAAPIDRLDDAEQAIAQAEAIPGAPAGLRSALLGGRAHISSFRGDLETAARMHAAIRIEHRSLGNAGAEHIAALNLAELEYRLGRKDGAIAIVRETLAPARAGASKTTLALLLYNLAGYLAAVDDLDGAVMAAREAIGIYAAREPDHAQLAIAIEHLALVFALRGELARSATLEGYAAAAFERHGLPREFTETTTYNRLTAILRAELTPDELAGLLAEGAALTPEAAIALALAEP